MSKVKAKYIDYDTETLEEAAGGKLAAKTKKVSGINSQTGTTYTPVLPDSGKIVDQDNLSAITTTIPPDSSVAFPLNSVIFFRQKGTGIITIVAGSGVILSGNVKSAGQHTGLAAIKMGANLWWIIGGVT